MKRIVIIVLLFFSIFQTYLRDFYINYYEKTSGLNPDIFYIPTARYIKPLVLGYDNLTADLIWIKTISYFADQFLGGRDYRYLEKLLYVITDLDPMFEKVVLWGGSILLYNGNWITRDRILNSTKYLEHSWNLIKNQKLSFRHDSEYWRIPHMIGFNYAIELKEINKGIPYIEEVAKIPGSPSIYKTWVSTLYKKSGENEMAVKNLERELILENLRTALLQDIDRSLKDKIIERLKSYYQELYDEAYARSRIEELLQETRKLRQLYISNFPYMSSGLFLVLNADKILLKENDNIIDRLFYEEL